VNEEVNAVDFLSSGLGLCKSFRPFLDLRSAEVGGDSELMSKLQNIS
jgi:hypothetical protein